MRFALVGVPVARGAQLARFQSRRSAAAALAERPLAELSALSIVYGLATGLRGASVRRPWALLPVGPEPWSFD